MVKKIPFSVIWDRKALDNLNQILSYLSKQSSQAPKIIRDAILTRIEIIVRDPKICEKDNLKEIPDDDFRAFVVYSYRVTYQIHQKNKEIRILRVRHTSREPLGY